MKRILLGVLFWLCLVTVGCDVVKKSSPEDSLRIYTTLDPALIQALTEQYSANPEQKKKILFSVSRETKDLPGADLILSDAATLKRLAAAGDLAPVKSEYADLLPRQFKDAEDRWTGLFYDPAVLLINQAYSRRVGQEKFLHWYDLLQQKDARIILENLSDNDSTRCFLTAMSSRMGQNEFMAWFHRIEPRIIQYAKFPITPVRMAATGDADIAITRRSHVFKYLQNDFPAYILIPEEGTPIRLFGVGSLKNSKKQKENVAFIDWLLQDPGARTTLITTRSGFLSVLPSGSAGKAANTETLWMNTFYKDEQAIEKLADLWIKEFRIAANREGKN